MSHSQLSVLSRNDLREVCSDMNVRHRREDLCVTHDPSPEWEHFHKVFVVAEQSLFSAKLDTLGRPVSRASKS